MLADHHIALVAMGGLVGAVSRYRVDSTISNKIKHHIPFGTLMVNILGSFFIGFFYSLFKHHILNSEFRIFIITGFLGAFSTFSSYSLHTLQLFEKNKYQVGIVNLLLNNVLGIAMVFIGSLIGDLDWFLFYK